MGDVFFGGRRPVTKTGGAVATAPVDVCLTPTPTGPVPVPYVNVARAKHLERGSCRVTVRGAPVMLKGSRLGRSTGNEPGRLGGLMSKATCGPAEAVSASAVVRIEGQGVVCDGAVTLQNRRNALGRLSHSS